MRVGLRRSTTKITRKRFHSKDSLGTGKASMVTISSGSLFATIDYQTVGEIVGGKGYGNSVAEEHFYPVPGHSAGQFG